MNFEAIFCRSEFLLLGRLEVQITHIKNRLPFCSRRSNIIRRCWNKISFLLEKVQSKRLYYEHQFERCVHFVGISKEELGFSLHLWNLLGLGLSFVPSTVSLSHSEFAFHLNEFANRLFWKRFWRDRVDIRESFRDPMTIFCEKYPARTGVKECPDNLRSRFPKIRDLISRVNGIAWSSVRSARHSFSNCTREDVQALKALKNDPRIIVRQADKNLGTVIITRSRYLELCQEELRKMRIRQLSMEELDNEILTCRMYLFRELFPLLSKELQRRLRRTCAGTRDSFKAKIPHLYCLIKLHKTPIKGRPIVAATQLPFKWISQYVGWRFNAILQMVPWLQSHLVLNSTEVVRRFEGQCLPFGFPLTGVTFDIVELYPSVPTSVPILEELFSLLQDLGIPDADDLLRLLEFLFQYSWFSFCNQFYCQTSGLAMGHPHSPPIANLIVYLLFERRLRQSEIQPFLYQRYLDDGLAIWVGCKSAIMELCAEWNTWIDGIKFTFEFFDLYERDVHMTFLDLNVHVFGHRISFSTHQKILNQYLYIHAQSSHPKHMKAAIIQTELIRFLRTNSHEDDYVHLRDLLFKRLRLRGYSSLWLKKNFAPFPYSLRPKFLAPPRQRESKRIPPLLFKLRYTLDSRDLCLGAKLNAILDESYLRELGIWNNQQGRIIICSLRTSNFRELILCNSDTRNSDEVLRTNQTFG